MNEKLISKCPQCGEVRDLIAEVRKVKGLPYLCPNCRAEYQKLCIKEFLAAYDAWEKHWVFTETTCEACDSKDQPWLTDRMILMRSKLKELLF